MPIQNSTNTGIDFSVSAIASGASVSINLASARAFTLTLNQNTTISGISNAPAWSQAIKFDLRVTQDANGGRTLSSPTNSIVIYGSIDPSANGVSLIKFYSFNGGSNWIGIVENTNSASNITSESAPAILSRDSNWGFTYGSASGASQIYWRSREDGNGEAGTGSLDFGYFNFRNRIYLAVAGGGTTSGNLKSIQIRKKTDNSLLSTTLLSSLIANSDTLQPCFINTSSFIGEVGYLRFIDSDNGTSWAWFGVDLGSIVISI